MITSNIYYNLCVTYFLTRTSFAFFIERRCFDYDKFHNPTGNYHGHTYQIVYVTSEHTLELECRKCDELIPDNSTMQWFTLDLTLAYSKPKLKKIKKKTQKFASNAEILLNGTFIINSVKHSYSGFYTCNRTTKELISEVRTFSLFNYFVEIVYRSQHPLRGTATDWVEYRQRVLQPLKNKLKYEYTDGPDADIGVYWSKWGYCLCGSYKYDSRKHRMAFPYIRINESESFMPIFPTWSSKLEKLYPHFADLCGNALIFEEYNRCTEDCLPSVLEEDLKYKYKTTIYIEQEAGRDFTCPESGNMSEEVIWILNDEIIINKSVHSLGIGSEEKHVAVDTADILHLSNLSSKDAGYYSCLVDGAPIISVKVVIVSKFVFATKEGQRAVRRLFKVFELSFIFWIIFLIIKLLNQDETEDVD